MAGRRDGCPCRGARVLRPAIDTPPTAQLSPAQRGYFFPCPPSPTEPNCWPSSAFPVPTAGKRCRSPTDRQAATTSSRDRKAMRLPATSPWSAAAATTTRALYPWGNGSRASCGPATLAPVMWQRSLSALQPPRRDTIKPRANCGSRPVRLGKTFAAPLHHAALASPVSPSLFVRLRTIAV